MNEQLYVLFPLYCKVIQDRRSSLTFKRQTINDFCLFKSIWNLFAKWSVLLSWILVLVVTVKSLAATSIYSVFPVYPASFFVSFNYFILHVFIVQAFTLQVYNFTSFYPPSCFAFFFCTIQTYRYVTTQNASWIDVLRNLFLFCETNLYFFLNPKPVNNTPPPAQGADTTLRDHAGQFLYLNNLKGYLIYCI